MNEEKRNVNASVLFLHSAFFILPLAKMNTAPESLGLIAGNRSLPLEFARQARAAGVKRLVAVAVENETDPALAGLSIRISDDGRGIAPDTMPGMGLLGMRERVRALGGAVAVGNGPNGGAVLEARFDAPGTKSQTIGNSRPVLLE